MEIFADSVGVDKENQSLLRNKQVVTFESMFGRTPLKDRKNDTKVFLSQLSSCNRNDKATSLVSKYEGSNLSAPSTPKRKHRAFKERRSCIPSFCDAGPINSEGTAPGITLPQMSEEEPDVYTQVELTRRQGNHGTQEEFNSHTSSASVLQILHNRPRHISTKLIEPVVHSQSMCTSPQSAVQTVHNQSLYGDDQIDLAGELTVPGRDSQEEIIHSGEPCSPDHEDRSHSECSVADITCNPSTGLYAVHFTKNYPGVLVDVKTDVSGDHMDKVTTDHTYAAPVEQCCRFSQHDEVPSCEISLKTASKHCADLPVSSFHVTTPSMTLQEIHNLDRVNFTEMTDSFSSGNDSYFEELSESTVERLLENTPPRISNHRDSQPSAGRHELTGDQETGRVLTEELVEKTRPRSSALFSDIQLLQIEGHLDGTTELDNVACDNSCLFQNILNSLTETPENGDYDSQDEMSIYQSFRASLSQDDNDVSHCCQTSHCNTSCQSLIAPPCGSDITSPGNPLLRENQGIDYHRSSVRLAAPVTDELSSCHSVASPKLMDAVENLVCGSMVDGSCQVDDTSETKDTNTCDMSMMAVPSWVNTSSLTEPCQASDVSLMTDHTDTIDHSMMAVPSLVNTSSLTEPCQASDVCLMTDHTDTLDHSMMAVPDFVNKLTMTDKKLVTDVGSSMTPIKVAKQGQRLTTESVRQLHPRIIANQLDTLMTLNQRLEKEVKASAQENIQLKHGLKVTKSKLEDVVKQLEAEKLGQDKHIAMLEDLHQEATLGLQACIREKQETIYQLERELTCVKEKCQMAEVTLGDLEQDLVAQIENSKRLQAESQQHWEEELTKLRRRYDESNAKRQLESSIQIIQELQAEKNEILEVFDDLDRNFTLQVQLAERLILLDKKVRGSAKKDGQEHEQLVTEYDNLKKKCLTQQEEIEALLSDNRGLQDEITELRGILNRSDRCLDEMEAMYKNVKEELKESKEKVSYYCNELMAATQALTELTEEQESLTQQLLELQDSKNKLGEALVQAEKKVFKLEQEHMEQEQL